MLTPSAGRPVASQALFHFPDRRRRWSMAATDLRRRGDRVVAASDPLLAASGWNFALSPCPELLSYDHYLISISGGKDSQCGLDVLAELFGAAGVLDRVTTVHADMGRSDWPGTVELAREHAEHYGLRHVLVSRTGCDLLDRVAERGKWPDRNRRWCTSDFKRGPIRRVMTALVAESRTAGVIDRPVRVLNIMGHRAQESPERRNKSPFVHEPGRTCLCPNCRKARAQGCPSKGSVSNSRRHVDTWLPIHAWTLEQVWARIAAAGTRVHPAYAAGFPRASCVFCVLSSRSALVRAAQLFPDLAARHATVEAQIGHRFRADRSMAEIIAEAAATAGPSPIEDWAA
ncbi:phosphoadenosine phosphosulfate reductase family protein [Nocardia xishanensis]|uniref:phosphoadenosine phosphosulfate reductase family protein n=1 Tax=Nocardia xishanensis TaxID=238964 RepID=UPI00340DFC9A